MRAERRKSLRLPLAIPVFVRSQQGESADLLEFATAVDVSAGGMLVACRRSRAVSSHLLLEIPSAPMAAFAGLPGSSRCFKGRVMRHQTADGYHLLAVKFLHPLGKRPALRSPRKLAARFVPAPPPSC